MAGWREGGQRLSRSILSMRTLNVRPRLIATLVVAHMLAKAATLTPLEPANAFIVERANEASFGILGLAIVRKVG